MLFGVFGSIGATVAEVAAAAGLPARVTASGRLGRQVVGPDRVLVTDTNINRQAPARIEAALASTGGPTQAPAPAAQMDFALEELAA